MSLRAQGSVFMCGVKTCALCEREYTTSKRMRIRLYSILYLDDFYQMGYVYANAPASSSSSSDGGARGIVFGSVYAPRARTYYNMCTYARERTMGGHFQVCPCAENARAPKRAHCALRGVCIKGVFGLGACVCVACTIVVFAYDYCS